MVEIIQITLQYDRSNDGKVVSIEDIARTGTGTWDASRRDPLDRINAPCVTCLIIRVALYLSHSPMTCVASRAWIYLPQLLLSFSTSPLHAIARTVVLMIEQGHDRSRVLFTGPHTDRILEKDIIEF
jgi:hypothetical protein